MRVRVHSVEAIARLPLSVHAERDGIDVHQHAMLGSPEFLIHGYRQPHFALTGPPMARPLTDGRPEPAR